MPELPKLNSHQLLARLKHIEPSGRVDLSEVDLSQVNMQENPIREAFRRLAARGDNRSGAVSPYIDLSGSNITRLDFRGYDMSNFIMSRTNASHAVFVKTVMSDTKFDDAICDFADFRQADLYHTKLYNTSIVGTNFGGTRMAYTHGLGTPEDAVERLSVVATIRGAELPPQIEPLRDEIQAAILKNRSDVSTTEDADTKPATP